MIADIRRRLETRPFEPFMIRTTARRCHVVTTPEQVEILPCGQRVTVRPDESSQSWFMAQHIVAVESGVPTV